MTKTDTTAAEALEPPKGENVISQRNGCGKYGVYAEVLEYLEDRRLKRHAKIFVCDQMVVTYERNAGRKSARWIATKVDGVDAARAQARKFLDRYGKGTRVATTRGGAFLVEMTATDLRDIAKGETPYARYTGAFAIEHRFGRIDDEELLDAAALATLKAPAGKAVPIPVGEDDEIEPF